MSAILKIKQGDYLFKEGDAPDALYIVKLGQIAITKNTSDGNELQLATFSIGQMLGEMTFFDKSPRTANAKAYSNCEVIRLPFNALYNQFDKFPEWLKAMVKTIVSHVKTSNKKIRTLEEKINKANESSQMFTSQIITQSAALISYMAHKHKKDSLQNIEIPTEDLRKTSIQFFSLPTYKIVKVLDLMEKYNWSSSIESDQSTFPQSLTIHNLEAIDQWIEWNNDKQYKGSEQFKDWTEGEQEKASALFQYIKDNKLEQEDQPQRIPVKDISSYCNAELGPSHLEFLTREIKMQFIAEKEKQPLSLQITPKEAYNNFLFHELTDTLLKLPPLK